MGVARGRGAAGGAPADGPAFRALLAEVRRAVAELLEERGRVAPGPDDLAAIRALVEAHVAAHERRAAALGDPGLADPAAVARRLLGPRLRRRAPGRPARATRRWRR